MVDPYEAERNKLISRFNSSRGNLLLVVAFSLINLIILITGGSSYFLFSACLPYAFADLAMLYCGKYPAEFYTEFGWDTSELFGNGVFAVMIVLAVVFIAIFFLCWIMSKNHGIGWLVCGLVLFAIDTVFMFWWWGISSDVIMDIIFHIWVIVSLSMGLAAHSKLKKLPEPQPAPVSTETEDPVA